MAGKFTGTVYNGDDTNEIVSGTSANETLYGRGGDDSLDGAGGTDVIYGGTGNDQLNPDGSGYYVNEGDRLYGEAGDDVLQAGIRLTGAAAGLLDGGADNDRAILIGFDATQAVTFTLSATGSFVQVGGANTLQIKNVESIEFQGSRSAANTITGGDGDDVLVGGTGDDVLRGGGGNDRLNSGNSGKLTLDGGAGDDIASFTLSDATDNLTVIAGGTSNIGAYGTITSVETFHDVLTGSGNDTISTGDDPLSLKANFSTVAKISAGDGNDTVTTGKGDHYIYAGRGADRVDAGDGNDVVYADNDFYAYESTKIASNDVVHGGDGNDTLNGGYGSDTLYGDAGDDILYYNADGGTGALADTFDGGAGNDTLSVSAQLSTVAKVEIALAAKTLVRYDGQTVLTATSVEKLNVSSTVGADITATGGNLADRIWTGFGDDDVRTLGGDDDIQVGAGTDIVDAGMGDDLVAATIGGRDLVQAGAGNDTLTIYDDGDTSTPISAEALYDAGAGTDTLVFYESSTTANKFDGTFIRHGTAIAGTVAGYESLIYNGTGNGTTFAGTARDDTLLMGAGDDTASGGAGADVIQGGAGNDTLDGGTGANDTIDYSDKVGNFYAAAPNLTIVLKGATAASVVSTTTDSFGRTTTETDTFKNFENVYGGGGNDTITGDEGANLIRGGLGSDTLDGGAGIDTLDYSDKQGNATLPVPNLTITLRGATASTVSYLVTDAYGKTISESDTFKNFENAIGGGGNDTITGDGQANAIDGGLGADMMIGGAGSDSYVVDNGGDRIVEAVGSGNDIVLTTVSYRLADGQEIEALQTANAAGTGKMTLVGNAFAQTITGNAGANTLDGAAGADTLIGLQGNDLYRVDNGGDRVIEAAGGGQDTVLTAISYALSAGQEIEILATQNDSGTAGLNLFGNAFANTIRGNAGKNLINGKEGADVLTGGAGADTFVFDTALTATNVDRITDFAPVDDTIRLSKAIFTEIASGPLAAGAFKDIATVGRDADDRILYDSRNGKLFYDADGSGKGAAVQFAVLDNKAAITHADFLIA